jgi:hypothetical protein
MARNPPGIAACVSQTDRGRPQYRRPGGRRPGRHVRECPHGADSGGQQGEASGKRPGSAGIHYESAKRSERPGNPADGGGQNDDNASRQCRWRCPRASFRGAAFELIEEDTAHTGQSADWSTPSAAPEATNHGRLKPSGCRQSAATRAGWPRRGRAAGRCTRRASPAWTWRKA